MSHPELNVERDHLEEISRRAYAVVEEARAILSSEAGSQRSDASILEAQIRTLSRPGNRCFGRIDYENGESFYVGDHLIYAADGQTPLVVSWQVPVARPWFELRGSDRDEVRSRRFFVYEDGMLVDIREQTVHGSGEDELLRTLATEDDVLAAIVESGRDRPKLRTSAATILQEQRSVIELDSRDPVLVWGGPGTGKTVVGLHRLAGQMYRNEQRVLRSRPLVIGPNKGFLEYVRGVLPSLGYLSEYLTVSQLGLESGSEIEDSAQIAAVKGDERMATVIAQWLELQPSLSPDEEYRLTHRSSRVVVEPNDMNRLLRNARRRQPFQYEDAKRRFSDSLRRHCAQLLNKGSGMKSRETVIQDELGELAEFRKLVDRIWPSMSPERALRDMLRDRDGLEVAADDLLDDDEIRLLVRMPSTRIDNEQWTTSDAALLDEFAWHLRRDPSAYSPVLIDEVQDLTPMQLRAVGRRAGGELTAIGDLAQACGPLVPSSWKRVFEVMGYDAFTARELTHSYRVPAQVLDLAAPLLAATGEDLRTPVGVSHAVDMPKAIRVGAEAVGRAVCEVTASFETGTTAIITPESQYSMIKYALQSEGFAFGAGMSDGEPEAITLLHAAEAKGLEFTNVVVVEPGQIQVESGSASRLLYVALTRTVKRLRLIHALDLPPALASAKPVLLSHVGSDDAQSEVMRPVHDLDQLDEIREFIKSELECLSKPDLLALYVLFLRLLE